MAASDVRLHVVVPAALAARLDRHVAPRQRSRFLAALLERELARLDLLAAAQAVAASEPAGTVPDAWSSSESAAAWVHELRREAEARSERLARQGAERAEREAS